MTFLPLVERELRAASRRRLTYWLRAGSALCALASLVPALVAEGIGGAGAPGGVVFLFLSYFAFAVCLLLGAFLGADCVSRERREGTLGFLFLSDLSPQDVILGKFCAVSLNAFFGLLAVFPILGLSLLAGGVTFAEFWRMCAALLNALFFATAFALFFSTRVRGNTPPYLAVLGLLAVMALAATVARWVGTFNNILGVSLAWASLLSPETPVSFAPAFPYFTQHAFFWRSLALSNLLGWLFLALAAWDLRGVRRKENPPVFALFRARRRRDLLNVNPIVWLLDDSPFRRNLARALGLAAVAVGASLLVFRQPVNFWLSPLSPFYFILKVLFAAQASRFFSEGRGNGALEILGATALGGKEMLAGQWAALRQVFFIPVCLVAGGDFLSCLGAPDLLQGFFSLTGFILRLLMTWLDFYAIGWFGMWVGSAVRRPERAALLTVLGAVILPGVLICLPNLIIDIFLLALAQFRLSRWLEPHLWPGRFEPSDHRPMIRS